MTRNHHPSQAALDAIDRLLDESVDVNGVIDATVPLDLADVRVVRRFLASDDAPPPDPTFIRRLREDLMDTAIPTSRPHRRRQPLRLHQPSSPPVTPTPLLVSREGRTRSGRRWIARSWPAIEFAAACLLILALFATATNFRFGSFVPHLQDGDSTDEAAMFLGDAARTGEMPGPGPDGEIGLLWRAPNGDRDWTHNSSPVVADGVVYVATRFHDRAADVVETGMAALELTSGHYLWETPLSGFLPNGGMSGPAVADGLVFVGVSTERWLGGPPATPDAGATPTTTAYMAGALVALDAQSGEMVWSYGDLARAGDFPPVVAGGTVFVLAEDGTLHAVDAATGNPRWMTAVSDDARRGLAAGPAVADGTVFVASHGGRLHAFDAETGAEFWSAEIGGNVPTMPVVAGETVFVGTASGEPFGPSYSPDPILPVGSQRLYALDVADGTEKWSVAPERQLLTMPTVAGETVLLVGQGQQGNEVLALNAADGTERWRAATDAGIGAPAVWSGETVYVGGFDAYLYALDLATGAVRWAIATAGPISTAAFVADGFVVFGSGIGDENLYAVGEVTPGLGTPAATPALDGDVSGLPPCDVQPLPKITPVPIEEGEFSTPISNPGETPAASVVPVNRVQEHGQVPGIAWADLPTGEPAPPEVVAEIEATLDQMRACGRPGAEEQLAAFYSDDFYRRAWVQWQLRYNGYWTWSPATVGIDLGEPKQVFVLPDGRVATVFRYPVSTEGEATVTTYGYGYLIVFVEDDGRWLVDEFVEITPFGQGIG